MSAPGSEKPVATPHEHAPQAHTATNAGRPQPASPEEYLDRSLPASGPTLHENLSWGDEWVGEPMPVGTPLSAGLRAANADAGASAALSSTVNEAAAPRSYVSPSLSGPGEWVGEPMPISPKPAATAVSAAQAASQTPAMRLKTPGGATPGASVKTPEPAASAAKPLGAIPWPKPGQSEAERKTVAAAPAESSQPAQKPREMPRTATGRLILKLLGNVASTEPATRPAPPTADANDASAAVQRHAAPRQAGPEAEPSIVDFIAGAAAPAPAEQTMGTRDDARITSRSAAPTAPPAPPAPSRSAAHPSVDATLLQMLHRLDAAMEDAQRAFKGRSCHAVGEAAKRIASDSDAFGLRVLARMASCVERAANANDMNALRDLLPELAVAVERNRITLNPRNQG